ncbi:hypothetical protein BDK51DRAFT_23108 [Blyttiomyces helicus]|uniref:ubiquitinyl hydrolase 1 n=1 Tax=Blyttiomyces helicus TaxID=388810 RepID=A0A4P9WA38_9FUNG|nr:hypothetical protein BDK51DRAFT_23108 [Blyttiomyces helicus]|eukprot:RKO89441.1 hypothetical protein BDK51DRAFT_23108 [Blyttiomyces helicus]
MPLCCKCDETGPSARLHACLHCIYMACWKGRHLHDHMEAAGHTFAMEMTTCNVFCLTCKDYVYDLDMERVLHSERDAPLSQIWRPLTLTHAPIIASQGLRGLRNMGSTCFMNAIIQSFIHNPLLRAHFLSDRHSSMLCPDKDKLCMGCEMDKLFSQNISHIPPPPSQFYCGDSKPYGPTSFLYAMWMAQKNMSGYAQQDAHEFFISVLNEVHIKCSGSRSHDTSDCRCIIHQVFSGVLQSELTCLKCGNVSAARDPILDISLDLKSPVKSAKKGKKKGGDDAAGKGDLAESSCSLIDCLER